MTWYAYNVCDQQRQELDIIGPFQFYDKSITAIDIPLKKVSPARHLYTQYQHLYNRGNETVTLSD